METGTPFTITSPSVILTDAATGQVIFEKNAHERRPVASVTKVMTILLTLEAIDEGRIALDDRVMVSPYASSMGGSQVFLDAGKQYPVRDLLKSVIVASANDAAVALGEHLAGTHEAFVGKMNERARQLGMPALSTQYTMFEACGRLYSAGLGPVEIEDLDGELIL